MIDSNLMSEIQDSAAQGKDTLAPVPEGFRYTPAQQAVWDWWCAHEKAPPLCDDLNDLIWRLEKILVPGMR